MRPGRRRSLLVSTVHLAMLAGAVLCFLWIRRQGEALLAAPAGPAAAERAPVAAPF
jgi:hypothetical protein